VGNPGISQSPYRAVVRYGAADTNQQHSSWSSGSGGELQSSSIAIGGGDPVFKPSQMSTPSFSGFGGRGLGGGIVLGGGMGMGGGQVGRAAAAPPPSFAAAPRDGFGAAMFGRKGGL